MSYPYVSSRSVRDCDCEDYPCCGHTDNIPFDNADLYCGICGMSHYEVDCPDDGLDDDEEEEDEPVS